MSRGPERGQATVELALCLPFVLLLIGSAIEITAVSVDNIRVWHATREAARVAAVEPDPSVVTSVATDVIAPLQISISPERDARVGGEPVVVETTYRPDADVPVIGRLFERLRLTARVAMRIEVP
ncbi:MAG: TadE/TadG family type IV pilus assembly protein [Actinomycetota bacterium]